MIDPKISDVQASYDVVADEYTRRIFEELEHKPLDRQLLDRFAAKVQAIGPACDMGCGPGHVARYLHERGVQVTGVDVSEVMVQRARTLNPGIEFEQGDMRSLDIEDAAWGGIVAFYSIIHISRPEVVAVLGELKRALRPGGLLLMAFHIGADVVHLLMNTGAMQHDMFMNQIRLFAEKVLPGLQAHHVKVVPAAEEVAA